MEFLILGALIAGAIGAAIGSSKGKAGAGFGLGFLLGPVGWVIAALLTPSIEVQAERDRQLAAAIARASDGSIGAPGPHGAPGYSATALRQDAITEALRRHPSLEAATTPEDLERLDKKITSIEGELRLRHELETVKARHAHEAELARQEEARQRQKDLLAEQEKRGRQEAKRVMEEQAAARAQARAERVAHAEGMKPAVRVFYLHRTAGLLIGAGVTVSVVLAIVLPLRAVSESNERQRMALAAQAASSASSRAAASSSSAASASSAAMEASASSAAAEASASEAAAARASQEAAAAAASKRDACLRGAKGTMKSLVGCDLSATNLSHLDLTGRDLTNANLSGANLSGVIFDRAKLAAVNWSGSKCPDGSAADEHDGGTCAQNLLQPGDALRPLDLGRSTKIGDWRVTVIWYWANTTSNKTAVAAYNREPGTGYVYALAAIKATYLGAGQGMASDLNLSINGVTSLSDGAQCTLFSDGQYDTLNTGQSTSYTDCIYLLTSKARKGTVSVSTGYSFEDAPAAYWAIPN